MKCILRFKNDGGYQDEVYKTEKFYNKDLLMVSRIPLKDEDPDDHYAWANENYLSFVGEPIDYDIRRLEKMFDIKIYDNSKIFVQVLPRKSPINIERKRRMAKDRNEIFVDIFLVEYTDIFRVFLERND